MQPFTQTFDVATRVYFGVSHASHPRGAEFQRSPIFGLSCLYAHTLQRKMTRFFCMHFYNMAYLLPLWVPTRLAPPSRPRLQSADRNVAVGSHGQYILTFTAAAA